MSCPHCGTPAEQLDALDRGLVEIGARVDTFDARLRSIVALVEKATEAVGVTLEPSPSPAPPACARAERGGLYLVRGDTA